MYRAVLAAAFLVAAACGDIAAVTDRPAGDGGGCADVVTVAVRADGGGAFGFDVTVRSADTGWDKYADAWEVRSADGSVLAARQLLHPHVDEQPFTRSLEGVAVAAGETHVTIAARDSVLGFCGRTRTVALPGRS